MNTLFTKSALALVAAALLVPAAAAAGVRPDDRAGIRGVGSASASAAQQTFVRPDDRAGIRGIGSQPTAQPAQLRPDDRAGIRGPGPDAFMRYVHIHASPSAVHTSGLDWAWVYLPGAAFLSALALASAWLLAARGRRSAVHA